MLEERVQDLVLQVEGIGICDHYCSDVYFRG